jgi:sporulation protein YlmC with PRC-barrel domain
VVYQVDAEGNYVGRVPDAILDYFVKSGHLTKVEAERIRLLQKAANGETPSNVFEFEKTILVKQ